MPPKGEKGIWNEVRQLRQEVNQLKADRSVSAVVRELKDGFKLVAAAIAAGGGGTQGDWTAEEEAKIRERIDHLEQVIAPRPDPVPAEKTK